MFIFLAGPWRAEVAAMSAMFLQEASNHMRLLAELTWWFLAIQPFSG